jgi:hypothetical protein
VAPRLLSAHDTSAATERNRSLWGRMCSIPWLNQSKPEGKTKPMGFALDKLVPQYSDVNSQPTLEGFGCRAQLQQLVPLVPKTSSMAA